MTQQRANRTILVFGATGLQGGKTMDALLKAGGGWKVRALSRDPNSEKAQPLKAKGVELVKGDFDDPASLEAAMRGVYGVFLIPLAPTPSPQAETEAGKRAIDAAKRAGVQHLVFSGVSGGNRSISVPNFESKGATERHLQASGVPYTILRPVSFMDNFNRNRDAIKAGKLNGILAPDRQQWFVAVKDIADFAVAAFNKPRDFQGQAIDLAGDSMTMPQAAAVFTRVLGQKVEYGHIPPDQRDRLPEAMKVMNAFYEREGYRVDVQALRAKWGIPLLTLEQWIKQEPGWVS
jgi:uncharacterized protein YbjT (DUF2867 family)